MSNKNLLTVLGIIIALAVVGGVIYYLQNQKKLEIQKTNSDTQAVNDLNNLLDTGAGIPDIKTPSANPLDKVAPSENPLDKTNPFKTQNDYQNPFN